MTSSFSAVIQGFSHQTTHVLRVYNVLSIHGWSEEILAENDDIIYEQPLIGKRDGNFGKFRFHFFV